MTGRYHDAVADKQRALDERYARPPQRFVNGQPRFPLPPAPVVINPVTPEPLAAGAPELVNVPTLPRVVDALAKCELSLN
ncbi:MAG: hypothetical protein GKR94_24890 [Gammaproteobacteria bacterium]|nr:hypothetical protein [Gammaproteobacteria bacterium]